MIYFTADLHLGHKNIIKHCNRPFLSLEEMNETLIEKWNSKVKANDTVYIAGDFMWSVDPFYFLGRLNGKKHLVKGNHDKYWLKKLKTAENVLFESISEMEGFWISKKDNLRVEICHYPMLSWDRSSHGLYLVYGHIHNCIPSSFWNYLRDNDRMLNAGVDINNFEPVTLEELIENNERFKREHYDDSDFDDGFETRA